MTPGKPAPATGVLAEVNALLRRMKEHLNRDQYKEAVEAYDRRMINIHPALLPKYGGKGMYGHHVHEAVKAANEKETGMTVHYVSNVCDGGEIIAQFSTPLSPDDTPETIADKVHELEMAYFPKVIEECIKKA